MGAPVSPLAPPVPLEAQPVWSVRIEAPEKQPSEGPAVWRIEAPDASPWYRDALDRISALTALAPGWNGYDALEVKADSAIEAAKFLTKVAFPGIAAPSIVPTSDGGVQVEWHRGGLDVEIAFSDDDPGVYVEDREAAEPQELALSEAAPIIARYWRRLQES